MKNVVVTGAGIVSSLGHTLEEYWNALASGRIGIDRTTAQESDGHRWLAAPVHGEFGAEDLFEPRQLAGTDRHVQMLGVAADRAITDAVIAELHPRRTAVVMGTAMGGLNSVFEAQRAYDRAGPDAVPAKVQIQMWPNQGSFQIATRYGLHGPQFTLCNACASSLDAIGTGARLVESGVVDVALVGGSDAHLQAVIMLSAGSLGMGATNGEPARACTPFDVNRRGIVVGEGAGVLVLESRHHATGRGAAVRAELHGYASMGDAYHPTSPDPSGQWQALTMAEALSDAGATASDLAGIVAHGTGTKVGDASEMRAINAHLGRFAPEVPVTSIKGNLGHTSGAAAVMSTIAAIAAMANRSIPPTAGTTDVDPLAQFTVVLGTPSPLRDGLVHVNAFGTGGQNASLVLAPGT